MKKIASLILVLVAAVALTAPANAGFRIGPRIGAAVNTLRFDKSILDGENKVGFTGGLQAEITLPLSFAVDASVLYVRRSIEATSTDKSDNISVNRDYIEVPLNIKWKIGVPVISNIVRPYIFTGPDFAFLTSKEAINDALESKKVDVSWNFGFGLELIDHLQISASYGLGITKLENTNPNDAINGRNNFWTVTAAWLF